LTLLTLTFDVNGDGDVAVRVSGRC
jgi:hypothetical protein